ncbi:MAG: hypothetical protein JO257_35055 [Deltaproteobacteria bacterium]|nr:hypothetical protein [Deltaproteobacteria bacterium]
MYRARNDLEASLGELKHVVQEKIDVKARARHAIDERFDMVKDKAQDLADRGKHALYRGRDGAVAMYYKGRYKAGRAYDASHDYVVENPLLVGAVVGGVLLAAVGAFFLLRRRA